MSTFSLSGIEVNESCLLLYVIILVVLFSVPAEKKTRNYDIEIQK